MKEKLRAYPMVILLLPLVAAILLFIDPPPKYPPRPAPNALQERLYGRLASAGLEGDELATVGALMLGYKEALRKELRQHFQVSGAAHVLAVSGLHTGILYGVIVWLLTLGGRFRPMHENRIGRRTLSLVIIAAMWGYAWLTGMTPSVVRAVVMVTLFEIGRMAYRQAFSLNTIAAAAFLILAARPTDLWSVSFQLSFAAMLFILALWRPVSEMVPKLHWTIQLLAVSCVATLGTMPLIAYYFHRIALLGPLLSLVLIPMTTLIVYLTIATMILPIMPLGWLLNGVVALQERILDFAGSIPGSMLTDIYPSIPVVAMMYGAMLVAIIRLRTR